MKTSFLGPAITANYRPGLVGASSRSYDHRGILTWGDIEAMKRDPQIAFGLRVLYAPLPQVKWKVKAKDPAVAKYVDRTLKRLWTNHLHDLLDCVCYGHSGGEVIWKHDEQADTIEFDRLDPVMPPDLRPLQIGRDLAGITVQGVDQGDGGPGWIRPPRALWVVHEQIPGSLYGRSRMRAVWIPWQEKTARHGALDVRRLWFVKNVFRGGIIRHPAGTIETAPGVFSSCQDYARELVEKMEAGGVLTLPNLVDDHGNQLWTYEEPKVNGDLTGVREYTGDLDMEILTALGIPPEVVKAADTGSGWSGRSVPFLVWLSSEDIIAASIIKAGVEQVCRPGVAVNYGEQWFEVEPVSLVPKQMTEDAAQQGDGDQGDGQAPPDTQPPAPQPAAPPPVAMSLDAAPVQLAQKSPEKAPSKTPEKAEKKSKATSDWEPYTGKMGARKGQSGWKNKTSGRVVWGENPPEKKPAAKPGAKPGKVAAKKPAGKVTLDAAKAKIAELAAGATSADDLAAHLAELHMTDLQTLKKELKLKVGGLKVEQAKAVARAAIAAAKGTAKVPAPAPTTPPAAVAKPAATKQPPEQQAMAKVLASPVTKVDELRDSLGLGKEEFDALILKLADEGQLVLSQDANPAAFTAAQRAKFVQDGDSLITAVMPSDDARAGKLPKPASAQPAAPAPAPAPQAALPIGAPHPASTGKHADGSPVGLPDGSLFAGLIRPEESKPNPALPDSSRPVLTGSQANAVYDYTSWAYEDVNRALRAGVSGLNANVNGLVSGTFAKVEEGLRSAFAATPMITPPPVEVHRGMNFRVHEDFGKFMKPLLAAAKTGGEVALAGYTSTTTDPTAAKNFLGSTPRAVHMKIKAVQGLDVGPYSPHAAEKELLLDHNSRFRVVSVTPAPNNSYTVELEQVATGRMLPATTPAAGQTAATAGKPTPAPASATGQSAAPSTPPKKKKGLFSKLLSW